MWASITLLCREVALAALVAAVVAIPLFFTLSAFEPFESAKAAMARFLAPILLPAAALLLLASWRERRWAIPRPLGLFLGAFVFSLAVATAASLTPLGSLWGSPARTSGTVTHLAAFTLFLATVEAIRDEPSLRRLLVAYILPTLPVVLYGLLQRWSLDPLGFEAVFHPSFLGNPNWLGAWLVQVTPLTLACVIAPPFPPSALTPSRRWVLRGLFGFLLVLQLVGVLFLSGRGALLGLAGGVFIFASLLTALRRRRVAAWLLALGLVGGIGLAILPGLSRVTAFLSPEAGTGLQRLLIWESTVRLVAASPFRALVGYGPETLVVTLGRYYPSDPTAREAMTEAFWDRAHNGIMDTVAATGLLGLLASGGFLSVLCYTGLRALGLVGSRTHRLALLGCTLGGGVGGGGLFLLAFGRPVLGVLGVAGGLVLGVSAFGIASALLWPPTSESRLPLVDLWRPVLLVGLLSGLLAHFLELQFGFETTSSLAAFWVLGGLTVVMARDMGGPYQVPEGKRLSPRHGGSGSPQPVWPLASASLLLGLLLGSLVPGLFSPGMSREGWPMLLLFFGSVWVGGGALLSAWTPELSTDRRLAATLPTLAAGGLLWFALSLFGTFWATRPGSDPAWRELPFFLFVLATVLGLAAFGFLPGRRQARMLWLLPLLLGGLALGVFGSLGYVIGARPLAAAINARNGRQLLEGGYTTESLVPLGRAVAQAPWDAYYRSLLGSAYLDRARRATDPGPSLRASQDLFLRATAISPRNAEYHLALSTLHLTWAELRPSVQPEHLEEAIREALEAARLDPPHFRDQARGRLFEIFALRGYSPERARPEVERLLRDTPLEVKR